MMMRLISCLFGNTVETDQALSVVSQIETFSSWANLPPDLLRSIVDRLDDVDSIRLFTVCTSWASIIRPDLPSFAPFRRNDPIPLLLLFAQNSNTDPNCTDLNFYNLATATSYSVPVSIPFHCFYHWLGHKNGWLVTLGAELQVHLIKPLTGAHILLPSKGLSCDYARKIVLCQTPDRTNNEFLAVSLNKFGRLDIAITGAKSWITMSVFPFLDAIGYKGKIYAISSNNLTCWSVRGSSFRHERVIHLRLGRKVYSWTKYLLEWRGELLVLITDKEPWFRLGGHRLTKVKLYKINLKNRGSRLSRVRSLGDDALFLGTNNSYAVSTSGVDNVRGNCIYFADVLSHPIRYSFKPNFAFGVFDLHKKTYQYETCQGHTSPYWPPPIWFKPC
ncbi:hypothetical protein LUZ61_013015 [Rhynchospora tenuis]|uniref:F-box domain-containing protein n=1 Tax=Rhynchospora tenuis TaxID=198213 RepID=A0AAD6A472_9POAL|nr:hypothetical protein LUZ61_013015 [Rhynchospora tenuis]